MKRFQRTMKSQRGSVLVLLAAGVVALLGATGLSVDIGYFFTFKNQLQNSIDSAAIAGAQGLMADPGNFSSSGRATQYAIAYAAQNRVGGQPVTLLPNEISFPQGNIIRINVVRPANTFFSRVLGVSAVNVQVSAAAMIVPATGGGGMRPFTVLDQFAHGSECVPPNDDVVNTPPHGDFNPNPHNWRGKPVPSDRYVSPYDPAFDSMDLSREGDCSNVTGLVAPRDVTGQQMALKQSKWLTPGNFGPAALGQRGADNYEDNIIYGYPGYIQIGDILDTETGNMIGPTGTGVAALIAQDPTAQMVRMSSGNWSVVSAQYPLNESPRIVPIPMYSVYYPPGNGRTTFRVDNIGSFFIEATGGQFVYGRFVQSRIKNANPGDTTDGSSRTVSGGGRLVGTVQLIQP
jgi:hypothetical protein